jgi:hypothetical protein
LPSFRVRVGELTSSMVVAAPIALGLAVLSALLMEIAPERNPEQLALLFGLGLMGTWANLVPSKLFEGGQNAIARKAPYIATAALAGLAGAGLASALDIATDPAPIAGFSALLPLLGGWWWLTPRDRSRRFRIWPLLRTGVVAGLLAQALSIPPQYGVAAAVITAAATQIVSPWCKEAAVYSRYVARAAKTQRKVA